MINATLSVRPNPRPSKQLSFSQPTSWTRISQTRFIDAFQLRMSRQVFKQLFAQLQTNERIFQVKPLQKFLTLASKISASNPEGRKLTQWSKFTLKLELWYTKLSRGDLLDGQKWKRWRHELSFAFVKQLWTSVSCTLLGIWRLPCIGKAFGNVFVEAKPEETWLQRDATDLSTSKRLFARPGLPPKSWLSPSKSSYLTIGIQDKINFLVSQIYFKPMQIFVFHKFDDRRRIFIDKRVGAFHDTSFFLIFNHFKKISGRSNFSPTITDAPEIKKKKQFFLNAPQPATVPGSNNSWVNQIFDSTHYQGHSYNKYQGGRLT